LVFYETYSSPIRAKMREKEIKGWRREKKLKLILAKNPDWADLSAEWQQDLGWEWQQDLDGILSLMRVQDSIEKSVELHGLRVTPAEQVPPRRSLASFGRGTRDWV